MALSPSYNVGPLAADPVQTLVAASGYCVRMGKITPIFSHGLEGQEVFFCLRPPLRTFEVLCGDDVIEHIRGHGDINSGAWPFRTLNCVPQSGSLFLRISV